MRAMEKQRIAFTTDVGAGVILVETADLAPGQGQVSRDGAITVQAATALREALSGIRPVAEALMASLDGISVLPEKIEAEFGVKLTAEAGIVLAKAATEAHVVVKLTWQPRSGGAGA